MATAAYGPRAINDTIALNPKNYGVPFVFALAYTSGKNGQNSLYPPFLPRVMFSAVDGRKLFLDSEDASEFERALAEIGIKPGELIEATMVKYARGGGHGITVRRVTEPVPAPVETPRAPLAGGAPGRLTKSEGCKNDRQPDDTAALLERSIEMAQRGEKFRQPEPAKPITPAVGKFSGVLAAALIASIDGYLLAAEYAKSKGLTVGWSIEFNAEDIRNSATSMMIESFRRESGGAR